MKRTLREELEQSSQPQYNGSPYPTIQGTTYGGYCPDPRHNVNKLAMLHGQYGAKQQEIAQQKSAYNIRWINNSYDSAAEAAVEQEQMQEVLETNSQHSISPPSSSKNGSDEVPLPESAQPSVFEGLSGIEEVESEQVSSSQANPQMSMQEMMARMREMEALLAEKDEQMQEMVTREEVDEIVTENNNQKAEMIAQHNEELRQGNETINQLQEQNADKDRVIEGKDHIIENKDQQIEGLTTDKSELKVEVKDLKKQIAEMHLPDDKSDIKGMSEFDAMSDFSDLGKPKSDKGSISKTSNSSVLRKKLKEQYKVLEDKDTEIQDLKDILVKSVAHHDFTSTLPNPIQDEPVESLGSSIDLDELD